MSKIVIQPAKVELYAKVLTEVHNLTVFKQGRTSNRHVAQQAAQKGGDDGEHGL